MKSFCGALLLLIAFASVAAAQDVCAPAKITSITVSTGKTTAAFGWTNSGDDCNTGTATSFEVRVSTSTITDTNWQSAAVVATGAPGSNGTNQCTSVYSGLSCGTTYYWVIFLIDEAGNRSPLSAVVQQATKGCETNLEEVCD